MILDLQTPKLDGWGPATALRRMPERIVEAGFTAYLAKPVAPACMRSCIASLLPH